MRAAFYSCILVVLLVAGTGCSSGGSGESGSQTARNIGIIVDSSIQSNLTWSSANFPMSGRVIVLDDGPLPQTLNWTLSNDLGSTDGSVPVATDGAWTAALELAAGDNLIRLSVAEAASEEHVSVTYNIAYSFAGQLSISPDVAYESESRAITATIALTDPDTNGSDVVLYRQQGESLIPIKALTDDGNLTNGDEIEADGIFTCRFDLAEPAAGTAEFRVAVGRVSGGDPAYSELNSVLITGHLTDEALNLILSKQEEHQNFLSNIVISRDVDSVRNAVDAVVEALKADPDVLDVGESSNGLGVWVIYTGGIPAVLYVPDSGIKGGGAADSKVGVAASTKPTLASHIGPSAYQQYYKPNTLQYEGGQIRGVDSPNRIGSAKVLAIAAQFWDWGNNDDVPLMVEQLQNQCFDVKYIPYSASGNGNVEDFKNLGDYGIVLISSHGDSFYNGVRPTWENRFKWDGTFGEVVLHSNMQVTTANKANYEDDLKSGRLVLWGKNYGIMPSFVKDYSGSLPNSLVYMSICKGTWNSTMAKAFLSRGAGAFLGYDDYVSVPFCKTTGIALLNELLKPGKTLDDAFIPGQTETFPHPWALDPAEFKMFGSKTLSIDIEGLRDGDFESNSISQAWTVDGDARIIPILGPASPTSGTYMAVVSSGLGFTTDTGTLAQEICLPSTASTFSFDWNFFSEEFLEYVGSQYQDSFAVAMIDADDPSNNFTFLAVAIDGLAASVTPVANSFDQGDVYATGWRTFSDLIPPSLIGKRVRLEFFVTDIGDSVFDTAVLVDNIKLE